MKLSVKEPIIFCAIILLIASCGLQQIQDSFSHKRQCLGLLHHHICHDTIGITFAIDEVVELLQTIAPAVVLQYIDQTKILEGGVRREEVKVGDGQL